MMTRPSRSFDAAVADGSLEQALRTEALAHTPKPVHELVSISVREDEWTGFATKRYERVYAPSPLPTPTPTATPTAAPTDTPTPFPTAAPTAAPTSLPTPFPTHAPTTTPTTAPTPTPTSVPTYVPTSLPSVVPTAVPSVSPTAAPSEMPTPYPSYAPSNTPSALPTLAPSALPTTYSYSFGEEDGGISNTTSARMLQQIWGDERLSEGLFLLQQGLSPTADTSVAADESTLERRRRGLLSSPAPTPPLSLDECDTDLCGATGGGWTLVRRVAPGSTWHPR